MIAVILWILLFIFGYLTIFFSADVFLDNLKELCAIYGISPFIIGLLIIGIDPEESIASIIAAINQLPYIAIGNVIGNSIVALTISFAIPSFFYQINIKSIHQFYFSILYICLALLLIGIVIEFGLIIVGILVVMIYFIYLIKNIKLISKQNRVEIASMEELITSEKSISELKEKSKFKKVFLILISFLFIFIGGEFLIYSTRQIIGMSNIPETLFGFVIIAFVTNVEELTLVMKSIKKKSVEVGLGGMIGKVLWNLTITFGISGVIIINFYFLWIVFWNWLILITVIIYFNMVIKKKSIKWIDGIALTVILTSFLIINFTFT
ncbi:MAG: sodium:calcium antiporter [Candidatus Thorarchaeota archaeon]